MRRVSGLFTTISGIGGSCSHMARTWCSSGKADYGRAFGAHCQATFSWCSKSEGIAGEATDSATTQVFLDFPGSRFGEKAHFSCTAEVGLQSCHDECMTLTTGAHDYDCNLQECCEEALPWGTLLLRMRPATLTVDDLRFS